MIHKNVSAAFAIALLLGAAPSLAELAPCAPDLSDPAWLNILIDDFKQTQAATAKLGGSGFADLYEFELRTALEKTLAELDLAAGRPVAAQGARSSASRMPFKPTRCGNRTPTLDGSDFTLQRANDLRLNRVAVEMWGVLDWRADAGPGQAVAMVGYVMPPVKVESQSEGPSFGVIVLPYTDTHHASTTYYRTLANVPETRGFALLSRALYAEKNNDSLTALSSLFAASASLHESTTLRANATLTQLDTLISRRLCLILAKSSTDPVVRAYTTVMALHKTEIAACPVGGP